MLSLPLFSFLRLYCMLSLPLFSFLRLYCMLSLPLFSFLRLYCMLSLCSSRLDYMRLLKIPSTPSLSKLLHAFSSLSLFFLLRFFHSSPFCLLHVLPLFLSSFLRLLNTLSLSSSSWGACMPLPQVILAVLSSFLTVPPLPSYDILLSIFLATYSAKTPYTYS
jgi:hypothetical protein